MSGPKYSTAYIREIRRLRQLEQELAAQLENSKRKQVLADISCLETERKRCCADSIIAEYDSVIAEAEKLIPGSKTLCQMKTTIADIKSKGCNICGTSGNSEELLKKYNQAQQELQKLKNSLLVLRDLKKQISVEGTAALQEKRNEEFLAMEWVDTGEKIETIPEDLKELYYEVLDLLAGRADYRASKTVIDETIMKVGDADYKRRQLELRRQALLVERDGPNDNLRMLELSYELQSLYSLLGWEAKEILTEQGELEKAIGEAHGTLEQKQKAHYIAKCVHEVFEKKGYALLDDSVITGSSGKVEKDYYEFGEDALINVAMSDKGQMLFEVVGNGNSTDMNATRAGQLESEMRRFCPNYAEIRQALRDDYGISLENEHLFEPDRKYAKAVDVSTQKSERRGKKEKKMMHYDD